LPFFFFFLFPLPLVERTSNERCNTNKNRTQGLRRRRYTQQERERGRAGSPPLAESVVPALRGVAVAVPIDREGRVVSGEKEEGEREKTNGRSGHSKTGVSCQYLHSGRRKKAQEQKGISGRKKERKRGEKEKKERKRTR
jgi:hypothetical protein